MQLARNRNGKANLNKQAIGWVTLYKQRGPEVGCGKEKGVNRRSRKLKEYLK